MVQYYTLQEAAAKLRISTDELKEMAKNGEVRAFQDRGNMRFRSAEIEELARSRGLGSDPDLQLGDAAAPARGRPQDAPEVFDFTLGNEDSDEVALGQELTPSSSQQNVRKQSPKPGASKTPAGKPGTPPRTPAPSASDSDVRLVSDAGVDFVVEEPRAAKSSIVPGKSGKKKDGEPDSGVRIVPLDKASDSDIKLVPDDGNDSAVIGRGKSKKSPSDSDVRLDPGAPRAGGDDHLVTEEIDLDAEERKAQESGHLKLGKGVPKPSSAKPKPAPGKKEHDTSSEFELVPTPPKANKPKLPAPPADDEVGLGDLNASAADSGINLRDPADSGISLEKDGSDEFELTADSSDEHKPMKTPKPKVGKTDSSSEFELALDESSSSDSDSEFELSLDVDAATGMAGEGSGSDSDSEFELTLDESGGLSAVEEGSDSGSDENKDIFETDFEVPALEEGSGSEAVALEEGDSEIESSSDFELDLNEGAGEESETGSQVVALDDEGEADEGAETVAKPRRPRPAARQLEEEEGTEADLDDELDDGIEAGYARPAVAAAPAEWGVLPAVVLMPCAIVMFIVMLMTFELLQGMWGFHRGGGVTGPVTGTIARMFDDSLPKE